MLTDFVPKIEATRCIGCELCVKLCPNRALTLNGNNIAKVANLETCDYIEVCQEICPTEAVSLIYEIVQSSK